MKCLLAIVSCQSKPEMRQLIRETWAKRVPEGTDYKFFIGGPHTCLSEPDEILLDCHDGYQGLVEKVRAIVCWAYDNNYDFVLKCDDDTVIKPVEMLASDFYKYDFVGADNGDMYKDICTTCGKKDCRQITGKYITPWGFNYWISRKGMEAIIEADLPAHGANDECWVSHVLGEQGIKLHHDNRYIIHTGINPQDATPREAEPDKQYTYIDVVQTKPRLGRPNRVQSTVTRQLIEIPMNQKAPSGHFVMDYEKYRQDGWLVRSKFTEVQATPDTFSFCIHLVWKGYHSTPQEDIISEFKKVFENPKCVWFDRRCFGGGSWRHC